MHGLREDRARHRRIRPRLLILARAWPVAAALTALALAACSGRTPGAGAAGAAAPPASAVSSSAGTWLQLRDGRFAPVTGPGAAAPVARAPWTVQSRVSDLAFLGDQLFCAINGWGLAALARTGQGGVAVTYHPDAMIFSHRTVTTLVPRGDTLLVHLYYNALLNDARPQDLSLGGISLVAWSTARKDYTFLVPPFQRANPNWEAVGFAAETADRFHFEWKFTDASETRFQYTRYAADSKSEDREDRDTFLASLGEASIGGPSVPAALSAFFSACSSAMGAQPEGVSLQFTVRDRKDAVKHSYRSRKESESAVVVPVFQDDTGLLALLPDGRLLDSRAVGASTAGVPTVRALPTLPAGFRYTDVVTWGSSLVLPWEETEFTDVARAGILVYALPAR